MWQTLVQKAHTANAQTFFTVYTCVFARDWMEGPMSNVDPDNVDLEVGNFWRGLYKLEKGFEGIASPKKIAGKVCIGVCWCMFVRYI